MKEYNKLVRDKIPEIMISKNCKPVTRILNDEEYIRELNKKLLEEVNEYLTDNDVLELADIMEVVLAILNHKGVDFEEFEKLRLDKVNKRGAFKERIFLERVEDEK